MHFINTCTEGIGSLIAQPTGVPCNHCTSPSVCPSVRYQLVKMLKLLKHWVYVLIFCMLTLSYHWYA